MKDTVEMRVNAKKTKSGEAALNFIMGLNSVEINSAAESAAMAAIKAARKYRKDFKVTNDA